MQTSCWSLTGGSLLCQSISVLQKMPSVGSALNFWPVLSHLIWERVEVFNADDKRLSISVRNKSSSKLTVKVNRNQPIENGQRIQVDNSRLSANQTSQYMSEKRLRIMNRELQVKVTMRGGVYLSGWLKFQ